MKTFLLFFCLSLCLLSTICLAGNEMKYSTIEDVPQVKWQELAEKKIYFGHQSVGFNIIDGIQDIMKEHPDIQLNIVESRQLDGDQGTFIHSRVGENRKPDTKIVDFVNVIDRELGTTPDAASLKFCYVDAYDAIDVKEVFQHYRKAMATLEQEHPKLKIIHFTMPLRTQKITWKTRVKLLAGKDVWEFEDNIKRNEFNRLLLTEYQGKEPVFDLARFEATDPDGKITEFQYRGEKYISLNPAYSDDGGHLNRVGRKIIAENLLLFFVDELL